MKRAILKPCWMVIWMLLWKPICDRQLRRYYVEKNS
jgi:hypothetical protein